MIVFNVLSKSYYASWQNLSPWPHDQEPFLPPYGVADVEIDYVVYAIWSASGADGGREVKLRGVTGPLPATWSGLVGQVVSFELPTDWEAEGFEVGALYIYHENNNRLIMLSATILSINANVANVRINAILYSPNIPVVVSESSKYAFLQVQNDRPSAGVVVRDGEENSFSCALNTNSLFQPHPDRAKILNTFNTAQQYTVPLPVWAASSAFPPFLVRRAQLTIGHVWAIQDSANLTALAPQALYPNRLWLLFGIRENKFVRFSLRTCQLNLYENNTPITQTVNLAGDNSAGWTVLASGSVAAFIALHNRTAAHTSSAQDVTELLQSQPSGGVFTPIPPDPRAVGVGVYYDAAKGWGAKLSAAAPLAVPSPLVQVNFAPRFEPFNSSTNIYIRPLDAVPSEVVWDTSLGSLIDFRIELYKHATNELIDAYSKDDARTLLHYKYEEATLTGPTALQTMLLEDTNKHYKLQAANKLWVRLYGKENFTYAPGFLNVYCRIRAIIHTTTGVYIAEQSSDAAFFPLTAAGSWSVTPTTVVWSVAIDTPLPPGWQDPTRVLHFVYRAAIFNNDFSDTPLSQSNNEFPNPDYTTSPLIQPYGDTTFTIQFPKPTTPGRYKFYVRLSAYKYNPDNIAAGIDFEATFAEVFELVVPPPLPPAPQGRSECIVCIPRLAGETITLLFPEPPTTPDGSPLPHTPAGDWYQYTLPPSGSVCFEKYHCGWYETQEIQSYYIDLVMHFDNRVWGRVVQGTNFLRVAGELERISDEVETERYVTKLYDEDDILRAFRSRYRLTCVVRSVCELWALELAKYAKTIDITARRGLVRSVEGLVVESFEIQDAKANLIRVTITLRERIFRREYRY